MNKSVIALAALATFAGAANIKVQATELGGSVADTGTISSTPSASLDTNGASVNPATVTVLRELRVKTVSVACGCYAGPVHCEE